MDRADRKKIYFSGDSFTYGEGLELYTPTEKWKSELYKHNTWDVLEKKLDIDSYKFRTNNSFVGLFRNHFKEYDVYQHDGNGGSLSYDLHQRLIPEINEIGGVDTIILQFTTFARNCLHLNYQCQCNFCKKTDYNTFNEIFDAFINYNKKNYIGSSTKNIILEEVSKLINFYDFENPLLYDIIYEFYTFTIKNQIKIFKEDYLEEFYKQGIDVFFIDSWDSTTSEILQSDIDINKKTIPLIGSDGNLYKSWQEWEKTLTNPYIIHEYPKTSNKHPTPKTHKIISESLIKFFNENINL